MKIVETNTSIFVRGENILAQNINLVAAIQLAEKQELQSGPLRAGTCVISPSALIVYLQGLLLSSRITTNLHPPERRRRFWAYIISSENKCLAFSPLAEDWCEVISFLPQETSSLPLVNISVSKLWGPLPPHPLSIHRIGGLPT